MLSFLRDQEEITDGEQQTADSKKLNANEEYLTVAAKNKNVRKSTILLAVLFGMGLLCLWFMIKKSAPETATAAAKTEEAQLEIAITRLTGVKSEMFSGLEKIVRKFYEFSDVQQVKVNELLKNPFELEMFWGDLKQAANTGEKVDVDPEAIRRQQLKERTKDMQLLSIMATDAGNCCMINDKILYEGDSTKGFKVRQIGNNFVKLELEDVEIILKLLE